MSLAGILLEYFVNQRSFLIPIVERLLRLDAPLKKHHVGAIIISPTRELATQIHTVLCSLLKFHAPSAAALEPEDEDSDSGDDASTASVISDRESAAEWEDTVENDDEEEADEPDEEEADEDDDEDDDEDGDDDDGDDDDEDNASEAADATACILCKGSKKDTSNVESDPLLACKGCGEHGKSTRLSM